MKIEIEERVLHFKQPAGTSRGVYTERRIWLVKMTDGERVGVGECAPLPNLSCDDIPNYALMLRHFCDDMERTGELDTEAMRDYPSMLFGLETAWYSLNAQHSSSNAPLLFDSPFARGEEGIPINGLVWMGTFEEMRERIEEKLTQGFRCVKLKIGAIDFDAELALLKKIRERFGHGRSSCGWMPMVPSLSMRLCINWSCSRNMPCTLSSNPSRQDNGGTWRNSVVSLLCVLPWMRN